MDPQTADRLSDPAVQALLASLPEYQAEAALPVATRLRAAGHDPELVAAVLTQSRLRSRARAKFGDQAAQMLLTPDGVEQATRWQLAQRHAARFAECDLDLVWDLGCGLGGDARQLGANGQPVEAVDADPATATLAAVNLHDLPAVHVRCARIEEVDLQACRGRCGAWLDPARRSSHRTTAQGRPVRTIALEELSPTWQQVREIAAQVRHVGVKLAPSFPHEEIPPGTEAQWASFDGQALECTLWWGDLVHRPGRSAQVHRVGQGGGQWLEVQDDGGGPAATATGPQDIGPWLYEPDRAVLQAGLTGVLARRVAGTETAPGAGYVTAAEAHEVPWARRFRVRSQHPLAIKPLRRWARECDVGRLTIKKRGVPVDPDRLRRDLRLRGSREVVVVLTPLAGRPVLLEVEPADP